MNTKRELIIRGLEIGAKNFERFAKNIGKPIIKSIVIEDESPNNLSEFMSEYDIPNNAYFSINNNGEIVLQWIDKTPLSEKDIERTRASRYERFTWYAVREIMIANGYEIVPMDFNEFNRFGDIINYYNNKDIDTLVEYYSKRYNNGNKQA